MKGCASGKSKKKERENLETACKLWIQSESRRIQHSPFGVFHNNASLTLNISSFTCTCMCDYILFEGNILYNYDYFLVFSQHAHPYSSPESPTGNHKRQVLHIALSLKI